MNADHDLLGELYRRLYATYCSNDEMSKRAISPGQTADWLEKVLHDDSIAKLLDVGAGEGGGLAATGERPWHG
jgi:hypothetical protein